ncbi:uncharacterized protein LOC127262485 [Andrographis paniculata]|uniref:uncharacterized protein LOC127262485 n=1 Tax=Andrographis paniculata TaxID=175694 RepID=UPI0021E6DDED|nr:uncharacterized protein LOC127262485 [Andrographis paniculata]
MYSSFCVDFINNGNGGDTNLQLDGIGYGSREPATFGIDGSRGACQRAADDGCKLVLGLGPTPSTYTDERSRSTSSKSKGHTSSLFSQHDSILKLGLSGITDAVSVQSLFGPSDHLDQASSGGDRISGTIPVVDEGSTSAKTFGGYMRSLIMAPRIENAEMLLGESSFVQPGPESSSEPSAVSNFSVVSHPGSSADHKGGPTKRCKFSGCTKGARGATSLCIGHGGGQRCQKPGCNKGSESRTAYCKAHGGGKRCQHLGCTKSAEGKTDLCIAHGGGRRCGHPEGCPKAARGKSGLCIKHGGGKRCKIDGCTRSAEGQIGLCISHGGGRRCRFQGCTKGAQGSTMFCKGHGGGKRCIFAGCTKGAEGSTPLCKGHGGGKRCMFDGGGICPKSVHGGTNFCVAHGGGKRCSIPGCTKSARGRTDCCVKHGGGKRCRIDNCGKSAQGSTDFCKAHGGGKRCSWGDGKCEKFARGKSGMCAAHGNLIQKQEVRKTGMIGPGLFCGLVHTARNSFDNSSSMSDLINPIHKPAKRQQLIPPQVLVPLSMKAASFSQSAPEKSSGANLEFDLAPEGRVHGGGLLSFFGGSLNNAMDGILDK